jgi:hypothetical protein
VNDILKSLAGPKADIEVRMNGQIVEPNTSLEQRIAEAGTTFELQADGRVAITNWPKPRTSNPNFLSEEMASYEQRKARD